MSMFEIICLSVMAAGVLMLIGAGAYCLACRMVLSQKTRYNVIDIDDIPNQYWHDVYKAAANGMKYVK